MVIQYRSEERCLIVGSFLRTFSTNQSIISLSLDIRTTCVLYGILCIRIFGCLVKTDRCFHNNPLQNSWPGATGKLHSRHLTCLPWSFWCSVSQVSHSKKHWILLRSDTAVMTTFRSVMAVEISECWREDKWTISRQTTDGWCSASLISCVECQT